MGNSNRDDDRHSDALVSIVMPVFNTEKYISEAIDSLINQSWDCFELIVVDDGSTDSTREIVQNKALKDKRVILVSNPCKGAGSARNHGLSVARGQYVMFLDGDDFFNRDMLLKLVDAISTTNADIAICGYSSFNAQRVVRKENFGINSIEVLQGDLSSFMKKVNHAPWNKLYSKHFLDDRDWLKFQNCSHSNDTFFVLASLLQSRKICVLPDCLISYRIGTGSSTQDSKEKECLAMLEPIRALLDLAPNCPEKWKREFIENCCVFLFELDYYSFTKEHTKKALWEGFQQLLYEREYCLKDYLSAENSAIVKNVLSFEYDERLQNHPFINWYLRNCPIKRGKRRLESFALRF